MPDQLQNLVGQWNIDVPQLQALFVQYAFSVVGAVLILTIGWLVSSLAGKWTVAALSRIHGIDVTIAGFFSNFVRYALMIVVIVMVLGQFGVQTTSIIATLGAAGLAIGLALQGTLQNIAAGIMLLVLRPFRVGEYIETSGVSGIVQSVGLFTTEFKTPDGLYRMAPNSILWNVQITNFSRMRDRRNDLTIGIGYDDDIEHAAAILLDMAKADKRVLSTPAPETFVAELGDSAVSVTLRYWTLSANFWPTKCDFIKAAKLKFDQKGVSIPFPQVTYNGAAPVVESQLEQIKPK
jgi:small conductance mechanosensitive channel